MSYSQSPRDLSGSNVTKLFWSNPTVELCFYKPAVMDTNEQQRIQSTLSKAITSYTHYVEVDGADVMLLCYNFQEMFQMQCTKRLSSIPFGFGDPIEAKQFL